MVREHVQLMLEMMDMYAPAIQDTLELPARMVSISTFNKLIYIMCFEKSILNDKFTYMIPISDPCQHPDRCNGKGTCAINDADDGYVCTCKTGYSGTECENGKHFYN